MASPIPWLIGTSGWAMFIHSPSGLFDLTGAEGQFIPAGLESSLPLDIFVVIDQRALRGSWPSTQADGTARSAAALVVRLPAVASDPGQA